MIEQIQEAANYLKSRGIVSPSVGIILGTGLGRTFAEAIDNQMVIPYREIPFFPESTVESHSGRLIVGTVGGKQVITMQGRFHYYEGYSLQQVTFPVRVMKLLGVSTLLISNAAGNLNGDWNKGELMLLDDHINLQSDNPLRGRNLDALGPRFPDMSMPYSPELNAVMMNTAASSGVVLRKGVYACVNGPNLETRAEYRFLHRIGADAVGMSTVPEVIVANHMLMRCCAVSVLTDNCDPDNLHPVSLAEIIEIAGRSEATLASLFAELIRGL